MYDIVVKHGVVLDPSQEIHEPMDVAISKGTIVEVRKSINTTGAMRVIDASDQFVIPGIIDLHVHCCHRIAYIGINPEFHCLAHGSTTVLDAGSTGELNFMGFRKYVIEPAQTRIFVLLNIESLGMIEFAVKNQQWPALITDHDDVFINPGGTLDILERNRDIIVGLKWAHHGVAGLRLARETADHAGCLLMAENHFQPTILKYLKRGDVLTHLFHGLRRELHDGLLDEDGRVQPEFFDARNHGVILDLGHGAGSFTWSVAETAFQQGIRPDTISTDLHIKNVTGPVYDMPTTMSKCMLLGMTLEDVVRASTTTPAAVLGKQNEIGTLRIDTCADLAILKLNEGTFPFFDVTGEGKMGRHRLIVTHVIKNGDIII